MLEAKGRYYELPLKGDKIHSIIYSGAVCVVFGDSSESYLNLLGKFEVKRHG